MVEVNRVYDYDNNTQYEITGLSTEEFLAIKNGLFWLTEIGYESIAKDLGQDGLVKIVNPLLQNELPSILYDVWESEDFANERAKR
jgi:hypothetical protein